MRFIKAVKIFDGKNFLPPGIVLVYADNGTLEAIIGEKEVGAENVEHFDGILTPGFINAHCHLELSHLKTQISKGKGFCAFAIELMGKRDLAGTTGLIDSMTAAEDEMFQNGIVAVGDISNGDSSFEIKQKKKLYYHTFVELIGLNPEAATTILKKGSSLLRQLSEKGLQGSLAAHAPYSASKELIELISNEDAKSEKPFSIHNQESIEEHLFLTGERSQVHDLYKHLGIDLAFFKPPFTSSMFHFLPVLAGNKNVMVHNTFTSAADIKKGDRKKVFWCFCPSANLYIENRLPDFNLFIENPSHICIGTDSLASNDKLDVLAELNILSEACKTFTKQQLLAMITSNGAQALGIEGRFGRLTIGGQAGLNLIRDTGSKFELIKKVL